MTKSPEHLFKEMVFKALPVEVRPGQTVTYFEGVEIHPGQRQIHFARWRYYVADWGRRTGKTIAAAAEIVVELAKPSGRIWIVAPTYELTDRVFEYVYKWVVVYDIFKTLGFGEGCIVKASKSANLRYIETKWGSFVKGKSAEAPDSLVGEKLSLVVMDECARFEEFIWTDNLEACTLELEGRAIFISTPRGKNWFFEYYCRKDEEDTRDKGWAGSKFKSADNPFVDQEWLESKRAQTPPISFRREYEASFEDFAGQIFPMFRNLLVRDGGQLYDPNEHELPYGTDYLGIDVGWRHPTACVWIRVDKEDNVWVFKEYLGEPSVVHSEHVKNINTMCTGLDIFDAWISPDAKRKNPTVDSVEDTLSAWDIYNDNGLYCRMAVNDVNPGNTIVGEYLMATLQKNPNHPKIFISTECPKLIRQLENYIFAVISTRKALSEPEKPRKYKDDLADALRYALATEPRFVPKWARESNYEDYDSAPQPTFPGGPILMGS